MHTRTLVKAGLSGVVAAVLAVGVAAPANADLAPNLGDAVAVGSDTVQYVADFGADGDPAGDPGFNFTSKQNRMATFDATGDASGRAAYVNGTSTALASTIVLRQGLNPVTRPNGSGAGIAALLADSNHNIDFVRSSRLPKAAEQNDSRAVAFGGLHTFQIATDGLRMAVRSTAKGGSNAPAGLSCTELVKVYNGTYKTWGDIPGYGTGAGANDGIVPILPQTGSGTRNDFLADLQSCNGGTAVSLTNTLKTSEEHDPSALTAVPSTPDLNGNPVTAADNLAPFSVGRDKLIDTGYFGAALVNNVDLLSGTAPDSTPAYVLNRSLYFVARQNDVTSTTPFVAGGSTNLVNTLFGTSTSWFNKKTNAALLSGAGVVQAFADKGFATAG